uniref:Uncharacterized protein n=1 Tax=Cacopsylla melanoneura TaxID=428564 RepID=A0A8D9AEE3_9HEMI
MFGPCVRTSGSGVSSAGSLGLMGRVSSSSSDIFFFTPVPFSFPFCSTTSPPFTRSPLLISPTAAASISLTFTSLLLLSSSTLLQSSIFENRTTCTPPPSAADFFRRSFLANS